MITAGTLLMEKGTPLPHFFQVGAETYPYAWMPVTTTNNPHDLETELATAGWTFFYMAGELKATAFGFDKQTATSAALKRLMTSARAQECNGLEIDEVLTRSFMGMPHISITAHSRHIQKGSVFSPTTNQLARERGKE
jgi:hypothetical protein